MTDQRRALLTEREREILSKDADVTDNYRYSVESRVRSRLRDRLGKDIEVIRAYYPEIFDELVYPIVCQPAEERPGGTETGDNHAGADEQRTRAGVHTEPDDTTEAVAAEGEETDDTIERIVADVSASWDDDDRLEARRDAARAALRLMRERGELGRQAAIDELYEEYRVAAQNERTWWRRNIRDAVKQAGSYSNGRAAYVWALDEDGAGDTDGEKGGVYDPTEEF